MTKGVDNLNKDLEKMNKDMGSVLEKMREPNKLCVDLCFMVIGCFVLALLFFVVKKYYNLKNDNKEL